jgi:type VI protein secretion system component Hcp
MKHVLLFTALICLVVPAAFAQGDLTVNTGGSVNCVTATGESGFNIESWTIGGTDAVRFRLGTGGPSVARPVLSDLSISRQMDACSAQLQQKFLMTAAVPSFVLTQYARGLKPLATLTITLTKPIMTSYQITGSTGDRPSELVSFTFSKVCLKEQKTKADGSVPTSTEICYDRLENTIP